MSFKSDHTQISKLFSRHFCVKLRCKSYIEKVLKEKKKISLLIIKMFHISNPEAQYLIFEAVNLKKIVLFFKFK